MMRDKIYEALMPECMRYRNLIKIPVHENEEVTSDILEYGLDIGLEYSKLPPSTGKTLILRQSVCERLVKAQEYLHEERKGHRLISTYAYRSLAIQQESFEAVKKQLGFSTRTDTEALEATSHFICVPEVAGHPTCGAVDLFICDSTGTPLDFGTEMHAFEKDSCSFSPFISDTATINRKILRFVMQKAGFAPYDGEWWHFSFGDRAWASYYKESKAHFGQIEIPVMSINSRPDKTMSCSDVRVLTDSPPP